MALQPPRWTEVTTAEHAHEREGLRFVQDLLADAEAKLVDVADRVDLNDDFDPRRDYPLTVTDAELTVVERNARAATTPDDIELDL